MENIIEVQEPWFSLLRSGIKKVEGKKGSPKWAYLQVGDWVRFVNNNESFIAKIVKINKYFSLEDFLTIETLERVLPGIKSIEEGKRIYMAAPINWTVEEISKYRIMAIEIKL